MDKTKDEMTWFNRASEQREKEGEGLPAEGFLFLGLAIERRAFEAVVV